MKLLGIRFRNNRKCKIFQNHLNFQPLCPYLIFNNHFTRGLTALTLTHVEPLYAS